MERSRLSILSLGELPTSETTGGTGRVAFELCAELARRGHEVKASAPWSRGIELANSNGKLVIHRFGSRQLKRVVGIQAMTKWGACAATWRALRQESVSVILSHHPNASIGASWAIRLFNRRVPVVLMFYASHADEIRTGAHKYQRFNSGWTSRTIQPVARRSGVHQMASTEATSLRQAARVVALSLYAKEWAQRLYGIDDSQFTVFPAGVDTLRFCPPQTDTLEIRQRLGLPKNRFIVFTLRNLHPRMGVDVLVRAMPEVVARYPDTLLIIGGNGVQFEQLQQMIADRNLREHVYLVGHISESDLPAYYQSADMFVLPTQAMEGFGMVTLEALACGTPVLGTPVGATPEILGQLGPEFLSDGCEAQALQDGILRLRAELPQRSDIRAQCRGLVEEKYTWAASAARLEDVLYSAIGFSKRQSA